MAETHLVSGLTQLRADCLGELENVRRAIAEMEQQEVAILERLRHVDGVLGFKAPELVLANIRPRRRRAGASAPGGKQPSLAKAVLRTLRTRKQPMSAREVLATLRDDYPDRDEGALLRTISTFLSIKKKEGLLAAVANDGDVTRYAVAA